MKTPKTSTDKTSGSPAANAPTPKTIDPFANDHQVLTLGEFTVENGTDKVAVYGSLDLTRDRSGLDMARTLKATFDAIVRALESTGDLPDEIPPPEKPKEVKNPFA